MNQNEARHEASFHPSVNFIAMTFTGRWMGFSAKPSIGGDGAKGWKEQPGATSVDLGLASMDEYLAQDVHSSLLEVC